MCSFVFFNTFIYLSPFHFLFFFFLHPFHSNHTIRNISYFNSKRRYCVELCQCEGVCFLECDTFNAVEFHLLQSSFSVLEKDKLAILSIQFTDSLMRSALLAITQRSLQSVLFVNKG